MSIDYKELQSMVKEAMFTGGGINEPSYPEDIPVREPAADTADKEQDMGSEEANEMYDIALAAREATEDLVAALDDPIFDGAYEYAFKASACLRNVLNSLEQSGAHPMPKQRVVAPPPGLQRYGAFTAGQGAAGSTHYGDNQGMIGLGALEEGDLNDKQAANVLKAVNLYMDLDEEEKEGFHQALEPDRPGAATGVTE